jgi:polyisoprenoid-binding protein YceI
MLRTRFGLLLTAASLAITLAHSSPAAAQTEPSTYVVSQAASSVGFTVYAQMLFKLKREGTFHDFDGTVHFDPTRPSDTKLDLTVYTASVDTKHSDENEMLRSTDFFDVNRFPTMRFVSSGATAAQNGVLEVAGELTIRGVTRRIAVPVTVGPLGALESTFQIDRTDFGLNGPSEGRGLSVSIGRKVQIRITMGIKPIQR